MFLHQDLGMYQATVTDKFFALAKRALTKSLPEADKVELEFFKAILRVVDTRSQNQKMYQDIYEACLRKTFTAALNSLVQAYVPWATVWSFPFLSSNALKFACVAPLHPDQNPAEKNTCGGAQPMDQGVSASLIYATRLILQKMSKEQRCALKSLGPSKDKGTEEVCATIATVSYP